MDTTTYPCHKPSLFPIPSNPGVNKESIWLENRLSFMDNDNGQSGGRGH